MFNDVLKQIINFEPCTAEVVIPDMAGDLRPVRECIGRILEVFAPNSFQQSSDLLCLITQELGILIQVIPVTEVDIVQCAPKAVSQVFIDFFQLQCF